MPDAEGLHGRATDDVYDRAGFGATVPRGPRPALVVVDLTRGFTEPGFPLGRRPDRRGRRGRASSSRSPTGATCR